MIGIGSTVGNYCVVKKLGSGAMGVVYLAEHPIIGKKVALKVIHSDLAENEEMVSRFFNEARAVTQIGHQNIIEVIDFGQSPEGDNFIVMELLEGRSLGDILKETPILELPRAIHIAIQMAEGLEASHARGIIHRDLKPDNIFIVSKLGDPDFVKILDFGLAKLTQGGGALSHKTRAGSVLGTPHYMAPEQCEGKPDIDHRVDVYALGCIMYQMLCGRVPFPGEGFGEVLVKHLREPPVVPTKLNPDLPRPIEAIILQALAKRKEFRFQSMKDLARALRDPERYVRELSGEVSLVPSTTMEQSLPAEVARVASQTQPAPSRPAGPVAKVGQAAPTLLDGVLPASASAAKPPNGSAATMLYDASAPSPGATVPGVLPGPGLEEALRPARSTLPRNLAIGSALLVVLAVGGIVGMRLVEKRTEPAAATPALAPAAPKGPRLVVIDSDPPGAEVHRGDESLGTAPVTLRITPGEPAASIKLHLDGYADLQRSIGPDDGGRITVHLRALPSATPPEAPVAVAPKAPAAALKASAAAPVRPEPPAAGPDEAAPRARRKKSSAAGSAKPRRAAPSDDDVLLPDF